MTPTELRDALVEFMRGVGPRAEAYASINSYSTRKEALLSVRMWPKGMAGKECLTADVNDWADVIPAISAAWEKRRTTSERETTRRMALAIIRITADCDGCSDAALRADNFDDSEIAALGAAAIEVANEMAANGPFSIVPVAQSNAMAAE